MLVDTHLNSSSVPPRVPYMLHSHALKDFDGLDDAPHLHVAQAGGSEAGLLDAFVRSRLPQITRAQNLREQGLGKTQP